MIEWVEPKGRRVVVVSLMPLCLPAYPPGIHHHHIFPTMEAQV